MLLANNPSTHAKGDLATMKFPSLPLLLSFSGVLLMAGCANPSASGGKELSPSPAQAISPLKVTPAPIESPPEPSPKPVDAPKEPSVSEKKLASAVAAFERGEYASSIAQLSPLTLDQTLDNPSQLRALKFLAFSQCLSRAVTACRQTFERAFRTDEKFDLAPAERGHPVWGPQFERARLGVLKQKSK
jgi:hypothetical protein